MRELIEANLFGDKVVGEDVAAANGFERFADEARRVMERRNNFDFGVVNFGRLDFDELAGGQAAEEIHDATATNHRKSLLPGGGIAGGFDDSVGTAAIFGEIFDGGDEIGNFVDVDRGAGAEAAREFERSSAAGKRDDAEAAARKHADVLRVRSGRSR